MTTATGGERGVPLQERRTVTASDGVELTYWVERSGAVDAGTLLLLHGAASNHTRWSEFAHHTRLSERWDVVRPDLRGNGASMTRRRLTMARWCRDLEETLRAEDRRSAVVIGHSLGAQIAIQLAYRRPRIVRGLVAIDPVFGRALAGWRRRLGRNLWVIRAAAAAILVANRLGLGRRSFPERDLWALDRETRRALAAADSFEEIAEEYSALGPILRYMPTANYLRQLAATVDALPSLEEIACPSLVLLSAGITFADLETNRAEAARFEDSRVVEIEANHWPLTEAPDEVREAIEGWIGSRFEGVEAPAGGSSDTVGGG